MDQEEHQAAARHSHAVGQDLPNAHELPGGLTLLQLLVLLHLIKRGDQPCHVFAQALPGLLLMFPDLPVQVHGDLGT